MNLDFVTILKKVIDICLVWIIFYYILKNVRKNVKFSLLFKGILAIFIISYYHIIYKAKHMNLQVYYNMIVQS